ncbi:unnamed protein product, partial [Vitis vinifera]
MFMWINASVCILGILVIVSQSKETERWPWFWNQNPRPSHHHRSPPRDLTSKVSSTRLLLSPTRMIYLAALNPSSVSSSSSTSRKNMPRMSKRISSGSSFKTKRRSRGFSPMIN